MTESTDHPMVVLDASLLEHIDRVVDARIQRALADKRVEFQGIPHSQESGASRCTNRATLVVFSGEMDKLMAAFVIASGAASMGMDVSIFFTFWGLTALKNTTRYRGKGWAERLLAAVLPCGAEQAGPSRFNLFGAGRLLFKRMMKQKRVQSLGDLLDILRELGVRMVACQMSMDVMGFTPDEMIEDLEVGGVATYLADAGNSRITLFI